MKGPTLYSRIQALCRVGVQGREKIGSHRGQRPDGHPWMEAGHPDLGTEEGEEATQRQRDPGESRRGEDMKERERERNIGGKSLRLQSSSMKDPARLMQSP